MTGRRRRSGVALADFLAGMLILSGALTAFAGLTRAKMESLGAADRHARALRAAEEALDRVRTGGLAAAPQGAADPDGFRLAHEFAVKGLPDARGRVEARGLRLAQDAPAHDLLEARVVVSWQDGPARRGRLALSTVVEAR